MLFWKEKSRRHNRMFYAFQHKLLSYRRLHNFAFTILALLTNFPTWPEGRLNLALFQPGALRRSPYFIQFIVREIIIYRCLTLSKPCGTVNSMISWRRFLYDLTITTVHFLHWKWFLPSWSLYPTFNVPQLGQYICTTVQVFFFSCVVIWSLPFTSCCYNIISIQLRL